MLQINASRRDICGGFCVSVVIGLAFYFIIFGSKILDPTYVAWLSQGDQAQGYLGWSFFRDAQWNFPVVGLSPNYGLELSNAVVYTDSNPMLAIIFKIFSPILPMEFQYFGMWLLLCCVLQAIFAGLLIGRHTKNIAIISAGILLLMFIPAWINRVGHLNLMGNFFILAAIYLVTDVVKRERTFLWLILICTSILVHLYLTLMISVFWLSYVLKIVIENNEKTLLIVLKKIIPVLTTMVFTAWVSGYFTVLHGAQAGGFGANRANILAPFLANGWSVVLKTHTYADGEQEGFNYFGLGVMLLFLMNSRNLISYIKERGYKGKLFLILPTIFLIIYSYSNYLALGPYVYTFPLPTFFFNVISIFRASGRFFWPVTYLFITLLIILTIKKNSNGKAIFILVLCAGLQIYDTHLGWASIQDKYSKTVRADWTPNLKSDFWEKNVKYYNKIRWVSFVNSSKFWKDFSYLSLTKKIPTDDAYMARVDKTKIDILNQIVMTDLVEGTYSSNTLYVMDKNIINSIHLHKGDVYAKIDGVYIIIPDSLSCSDCESIKPAGVFPKKLDFTGTGPDSNLLIKGWSTQEGWGVWNDGTDASLLVPLMGYVHQLTFTFNALITSTNPVQNVIMTINGNKIADISITQSENNEVKIILPAEITKSKNSVRVDLEFPNAVASSNGYSHGDHREIAIGIKSVLIQ